MPDTAHPVIPDRTAVDPETTAALPRANPRLLGGIVAAILLGLLLILIFGAVSRLAARTALHRDMLAEAVPAVAVSHPKLVAPASSALPSTIAAWNQATIYARIDGYLKSWRVDIGSHVQKGDVLADIDTPDLDQQLRGARAALGTADAKLDLARVTAARWQKLLQQNAVSHQSADDRQGAYAEAVAERSQAEAELQRLQALTGFKQLIAPFDGVVTTRSTDVGHLINAGRGTAAPLFTVADLSRLRIYVSVPQPLVAAITKGTTAHFTVPELPGQDFSAKVYRTADSIDPTTDTMLVQLVYDNRAGILKPGAYADLTFDLPQGGLAGLVNIPADALLFRSGGTSVAVVGPDSRVRLVKIRIVTDLGTSLNVTGKLGAADTVIDSPNDAIGDGDPVRAEPAAANRS